MPEHLRAAAAPLSRCGWSGMTIGPIAYSCRSVPQMPHHSGRISTSPAPGGRGSVTSSTRTSCSPWKTAAFISSLQARVDENLALQPPGREPVELLGHARRAGGRPPAAPPPARCRRAGPAPGRGPRRRRGRGWSGCRSPRITSEWTSISCGAAGMPTCRTVPPGRASPIGDVQLAGRAAGLDHHVGARRTDGGRDVAVRPGPTRVAPSRAARSSREPGKSTTVRSTSARCRSPASTNVPIAPAPMSTTRSPSTAPERRAACRPTASGWASPAASTDSPPAPAPGSTPARRRTRPCRRRCSARACSTTGRGWSALAAAVAPSTGDTGAAGDHGADRCASRRSPARPPRRRTRARAPSVHGGRSPGAGAPPGRSAARPSTRSRRCRTCRSAAPAAAPRPGRAAGRGSSSIRTSRGAVVDRRPHGLSAHHARPRC